MTGATVHPSSAVIHYRPTMLEKFGARNMSNRRDAAHRSLPARFRGQRSKDQNVLFDEVNVCELLSCVSWFESRCRKAWELQPMRHPAIKLQH